MPPLEVQRCRNCGVPTIYIQLISNDTRMTGWYCTNNCMNERRSVLEPLPPITFHKVVHEEESITAPVLQEKQPDVDNGDIWKRLFDP